MARVELYGAIEYLAAVLKLSAEDTANLIKEATGVDVNPGAADLLRDLNYAQLEVVWERLSGLAQGQSVTGRKAEVEDEGGNKKTG